MAGPSAATNFLSPEDYAQLLRQAEMENRAGLEMNQAPRHWTQALAGALNQGLSGYREGQAREQYGSTQDHARKSLAAMLQGNPEALAAAMSNPVSAQQAFQYQMTAPQREAQAFNLAQAKANAPLERQLMEAKLKAATAPSAPKFTKLGTDAYGQERYGFVDPRTGQITPYAMPGVTPGQMPSQAVQGNGGVNSIPPPPPGVNAQEYYKQASKELAKTSVAARQNWPSVNAKIDNALGVIDGVLNSPAFERSTSVITGPLPSLSADARNFDEMVEQLRGQAFVQAFQDIKGGGAITETEGRAATQALARLRSAQVGSGNFKKALADFKREMIKLREIAAEKAGVDLDGETAGAPTAPAAPPRRRWTPERGLE